MKKLLLTLLIGTSLSLAAPAFAHEGEDHGGSTHEQGMSMPESVPAGDAMAKVESGYAALSEAATTGQYDKIHESIRQNKRGNSWYGGGFLFPSGNTKYQRDP